MQACDGMVDATGVRYNQAYTHAGLHQQADGAWRLVLVGDDQASRVSVPLEEWRIVGGLDHPVVMQSDLLNFLGDLVGNDGKAPGNDGKAPVCPLLVPPPAGGRVMPLPYAASKSGHELRLHLTEGSQGEPCTPTLTMALTRTLTK